MTSDVRQVAIGIPSYEGSINAGTVHCLTRDLLELLSKKILLHFIFVSNGTYISHTRNQIVDEFMRMKDATDLVFIDSDMEWEPGALFKLLNFDADIVGAGYRRKNDDVDDYNMSFLNEKELWADKQGLIEVEVVPTGFMRIRRKVFGEQMEKIAVGLYKENQGQRLIHNFFYQEQRGDVFYGEDFIFCLNCRARGYPIMMYPEMQIDHIGRQSYKGHVGNWLRNRMERSNVR